MDLAAIEHMLRAAPTVCVYCGVAYGPGVAGPRCPSTGRPYSNHHWAPDYPAMARVVGEMIAAAHAAGVAQERERAAGVAADHQAICTDDEQSCQCGFTIADAIRAGEGAGA